MFTRHHRSVVLPLILLLAVLTTPILAQSDVRTFPETGHTLRGVFRGFWEANGGVAIFGYPITEEYTASSGRLVQWFERARFELVALPSGWAVDLGHLGIEASSGKIFPKVPPTPNTPDQRYFPETQHSIKYGFKEIWETRGAERIFGYPISEEIDEVLNDGAWHTVQYFERARFEYWPDLPPGQRVLISLLGRKLVSAAPQVSPTAQPISPTNTAPGITPTASAPTATPTRVPTATPTPATRCDPSYPDVCIPPPPPDLDCGDIPYRNFRVLPPDPHGFDGKDNDGIGCES